ncbi:hypothetical protein BAE44_0026176 [Dichanthelium oligosanthes]|uniref:F-box domain-containing protein n=1 Tax=Dichanthelium oligosanthes TaxID=888268 RepID=A0A1E5UIV5_9POAL|nr:hypothetical protein BAE44_0026176 [Dichanthelium oligosanthes]
MEVNGGGGVWLPEDVIFAVLSWLPVKPLCRFRCVSKGWRALISSPGFIAAQKSRAAPLLVGVFAAPPDDDEPAERRNFPPGVCVVLKVPDDELRVMDADGNVLRVLRNMISSYDNLLPTRLDLVCVDKWRNGASVIDPATRRVVTVRRRVHGKVNSSTNRFGRASVRRVQSHPLRGEILRGGAWLYPALRGRHAGGRRRRRADMEAKSSAPVP